MPARIPTAPHLQALAEAPPTPPPLRLRDIGSYHVGGRRVVLDGRQAYERLMAEGGQPIRIDPNGSYLVEQMYAQYFLSDPGNGRVPVLFWHGGGMTGATWETTPDGRPGWLQHFLGRGWDCHLCDAMERGRSGFAPVPDVWAEPPVAQTADDLFARFRIGAGPGSYHVDPALRRPYPNTRFPVAHFDTAARQFVPRWTHTDAAILAAYLQLLERSGPAAIVCHSQGGVFALRAAQARPDLVRAIVALEPASTPEFDAAADYRTPTLVLLGDNIDTDARWPKIRERILGFARRHPSTEIVSLPELGIAGNSHLLMMDTNSLALAELAHRWLIGRDETRLDKAPASRG